MNMSTTLATIARITGPSREDRRVSRWNPSPRRWTLPLSAPCLGSIYEKAADLKSGKFVTEGNKKLRPFHAENSMEACQSSLTIPDPYPPPVHSLPPGSPCCRHPKIPRPFHLQGFLPPALSLFNKHGTKACHDPSDQCIWHWTVKSCAFQL